jgi:hypothetical protein
MELTPEMQQELREAKERAGSFVGAAKVASLNGWSVGFLALIVAYCLWSIFVTVVRPDPQMAELTDLLGGGTGELVQSLTVVVYVVVIAATVVFQGLNARYYYVRTARIQNYVRDTPPWVLDLQRSAVID